MRQGRLLQALPGCFRDLRDTVTVSRRLSLQRPEMDRDGDADC
jgi:hypothetical protein